MNENNQVKIAAVDGITMILPAMMMHSPNACVQHYGCAALWYLAVNEKNQVVIAETGGITTILSEGSFIKC